jgi:hypothetical protein
MDQRALASESNGMIERQRLKGLCPSAPFWEPGMKPDGVITEAAGPDEQDWSAAFAKRYDAAETAESRYM